MIDSATSPKLESKISDLPIPQKSERPLHMAYLDGLRGVAAFYVVLHHLPMFLNGHLGTPEFSPFLKFLVQCLDYGHYAVATFIVLSGYVLMIPVVRSSDNQLKGGVVGFIKRRAQRILPTYYAALLMISAVLFYEKIKHVTPNFHDGITLKNFVLHIFLVHNLFHSSRFAIDGPMWSLAAEWQIYFVFALLLMPLYRRFGLVAAVIVAFVIGCGIPLVLGGQRGAGICPWYISLFACGMFAAQVSFGKDRWVHFFRTRVPWGTICCIGIALFIYLTWGPMKFGFLEWIYLDLISGFATTALILYCTNSIQASQDGGALSPVVKFLQSKPLILLGTFSYSLYLCHLPIVQSIIAGCYQLHLSSGVSWAITFGSLPLILAICYGFYWIFERPFTTAARVRPVETKTT